MIDSSTIGPVEILAVSFPGSQFKGEILPELEALIDRGLIRVIDLVIVTKGKDGTVAALEASELDPKILSAVGKLAGGVDADGLLGEEDIEMAAEELEPGSSAALLVWEDLWAAPIAAAIRNAGGIVLAHERVPHEAVLEVVAAVSG